MKIFLDPHKDGCTVWFDDGNIQTLRESHDKNLEKIKEFTTIVWYDDHNKKQVHKTVKVFIDSIGSLGSYYFNWLDDNFVDVRKCSYKERII